MFARSTLAKTAIVAFTLVTSIGGAASMASAQGPYVVYGQRPGTKLQVVTYRDLNLLYPAHQAVLNQRVGHAVRHVCSYDNGNIPTMDNDYKVCRNDACRWAYFDASRNHSSVWCSMALCGNQAKGRAFRDRRRGPRSA